jgi:hypothetical protein
MFQLSVGDNIKIFLQYYLRPLIVGFEKGQNDRNNQYAIITTSLEIGASNIINHRRPK